MTRKAPKGTTHGKRKSARLAVSKQTLKNLAVTGKDVQGGRAPDGGYTKVSACANQCC